MSLLPCIQKKRSGPLPKDTMEAIQQCSQHDLSTATDSLARRPENLILLPIEGTPSQCSFRLGSPKQAVTLRRGLCSTEVDSTSGWILGKTSPKEWSAIGMGCPGGVVESQFPEAFDNCRQH